MHIDSDFDSGNIQLLDASDPRDIRLALRPDRASGHCQWFHFRVDGLQPGQTYRLRITNAGQSSYPSGWPNYRAVASWDQQDWFRVPTRYDGQNLIFEITAEQPQVWFAYFQPYTRERHAARLQQALANGAELLASGRSLEGREVPLLRIRRHAAPLKLWLIAQQHPGEHMAEWFMEGLIERLQTPGDATVEQLLAHAEFYLAPNMNPDGAFHGNLRTNAAGTDLNRAWAAPSAQGSPEVLFIREQMQAHGVDLFLDIHGDEAIPYVFAAGCEGIPGYSPRLAELERRFRERLQAHGEFQSVHGYPRAAPGKANLALACNQVGQTWDCLAFTLEMPFKDHDLAPDERTGWSAQRAKRLASAVLDSLAEMLTSLR